MKKEFVCIQCPRGCKLTVDTETLEVKGFSCLRGKEYGVNEATHPTRTVTSTVKVENGEIARVSVKTSTPIPKELIFEVMKEIDRVRIKAPVAINQVIIKNVLNTNSDIIATKSVGIK